MYVKCHDGDHLRTMLLTKNLTIYAAIWFQRMASFKDAWKKRSKKQNLSTENTQDVIRKSCPHLVTSRIGVKISAACACDLSVAYDGKDGCRGESDSMKGNYQTICLWYNLFSSCFVKIITNAKWVLSPFLLENTLRELFLTTMDVYWG